MTEDARGGEEDGGTSEPTSESRPLEGHGVLPLHGLETGWTVLGDPPEAVGPADTGWTGTLRPFSGVLGPWRPTVDDLHPRLSFLSLPWLVREVHTTGGPVSADRPADSAPTESLTLETTTVSRILRSVEDLTVTPPIERDGHTTARSDEPTAESSSGTVETVREVLRWRPVLGGRQTPPAWAGERPEGNDGVASRPPTPVPRTFRTAPDTGRVDDREERRESGRIEDERTRERDRRSVTTTRTDVETVREIPGSVRPAWPKDTREPVDIRRTTDEFRPVLSTGGTPRMHHRFAPEVSITADDPSGRDRSVAPGTIRPGESWKQDAQQTAGDGSVWPGLSLQGGQAVSPPGDGRSVGTDPDAGRSSAAPTGDADAGRTVALTYRNGAIQRTGTARGSEPPEMATPDAGTRWSTGSAVSPRPDAETSGQPHPSAGEAPTNPMRSTENTDAAPPSPFASFTDTDAAVEHVYHEIERRLRIERERRGL